MNQLRSLNLLFLKDGEWGAGSLGDIAASAYQPAPVFLPGESHGQRRLAGCGSQGRKELDTTEATERAGTLVWF